MKFLHPRSALRFGAACLAFAPFAIEVRATNDDGCQTVEEIICATDSFEKFCDGLNALDHPDVEEILDESHLTVFVPTKAAFNNLLHDLDLDSIDDFSDNTLEDLLLVHIHQGGFFSREDLEDRCGDLLGMANHDDTRTKCEDNADKIYQKGPRNLQEDMPRIISFDILACNGSVIHVVNKVILPSHFELPTSKPTGHPAPNPTRHPTNNPTRQPVYPTKQPTPPTRKPTSEPTTKADSGSASCSAHPECAHLVGDCCPTDDGARLDCCSEVTPTRRPTSEPTRKPTPNPTRKPTSEPTRKPTPNPTRKPTSKPTYHEAEASCAAYPKCRELGLEGDCCPTDDGKKLACCFDEGSIEPEGSCSTSLKCRELGLKGDCCPTDDGMKLDCCFDRKPGTCSRYPGCAAKELEGDCCPAANGKMLDCCYEDEHLFPIIDSEYCKHEPDFSCYKFGRPECCLKSTVACPKEEPECEVGFPILGESYCTYAPNYGCFENGWPKCCDDDPKECPNHCPDCEVGVPVVDDSYCSRSPDYRCFEYGYPTCCLRNNGNDCPNERPECNVGKRGCDLNDSLPSIKDFACSQRNFDVLCYLLRESEIEELLDDTGTYTLFAPSNDAFKEFGDANVEDLLEDPTGELQDILKYHISDRIYFEKDLYCDRKIDSLRGDTSDDFTTTECNFGLFQKGDGNDSDAYPLIVATDIITCNGVVHVVDKVILPKE